MSAVWFFEKDIVFLLKVCPTFYKNNKSHILAGNNGTTDKFCFPSTKGSQVQALKRVNIKIENGCSLWGSKQARIPSARTPLPPKSLNILCRWITKNVFAAEDKPPAAADIAGVLACCCSNDFQKQLSKLQ